MWASAGAGAVSGAMAGMTGGLSLLGSVGSGALIGGANYGTYNLLNGTDPTLEGYALSMGTGAAMSGITYGISNVSINRGLDGAQAMLKTPSANAWGTLADGTNQGIKHFSNYWETYPERIPSIANRLGVDPSDFSNTVNGFESFTKAAQNIIANPNQMRALNGKSLYFVEGAQNINKGVTVIVQDGKIQSMMPTALKDFLKLK